jgi:hypothetical protein
VDNGKIEIVEKLPYPRDIKGIKKILEHAAQFPCSLRQLRIDGSHGTIKVPCPPAFPAPSTC